MNKIKFARVSSFKLLYPADSMGAVVYEDIRTMVAAKEFVVFNILEPLYSASDPCHLLLSVDDEIYAQSP